MDRLVVETPEQISLEFALAGIGTRSLALALDTILQLAAGVLLGFVSIVLGLINPRSQPHGAWILALIVLLAFLLQFGYFAFFETVWNGQTPGKRSTNLRVIQDTGRPITVYEAVARNLLRIVDGLPVLYGVAIISVLLNPRNKRLGDYVAGTVVVYERPAVLETGNWWDPATSSGGSRYDVSRLALEEFQLIEAFLLRRSQLSSSVRVETARRITQHLAARLGFSPEDERNPETLLESLAAAYRDRARFR